MRLYLAVSLLCLLTLSSAVNVSAIGVPAGTIIQPTVQAVYSDSSGNSYSAVPASVTLIVRQVAGVSVQAAYSQIQGAPGQEIYVHVRVTNLGNGPDSFGTAASSTKSWPCVLLYDENGDGIHQSDEQTVMSATGTIAADAWVSCFARVSIPSDATAGDSVNLYAVSNYDSAASAQTQFAIQVNTDLPTIAITSPTSGPTWTAEGSTIDIAGTASGSLGISGVRWETDRGASGVCSGTDSWTAAGIPLPDGSTLITVTATDSGGRTATDHLTVTYTTADTSAPTVTITGPTSASTYTTTSSSLNLSGSASDNIGVVSVDWSNNRGGSGSCTGTNAWSAAGISLQSGQNVITVAASDAAGNRSTDTITVTYNVPDTALPTVTITSPTSASTYTTTSSLFNLSGSASDNIGVVSVAWSNDRGGTGSCTGTTAWSAANIFLQSGQNIITVTASDAAGNGATDTLTVTCSVPDTTDPSVTITGPTSSSDYSTTISSISLSGSALDNVGVTSVTWSNDRGGSGSCAGTTSWSAAGIALQLGQNVLTVTASDGSGNKAADVLTVDYQLPDTSAPTVAIAAPTSMPTYKTASLLLDIAGTASDNVGVASVSWSNDRGGSGFCTGTTTWSAARVALSIGDNVISVTAFDAAGNRQTDVLTVTCEAQDKTAPAVTITSPTGETTHSTTSPAIILSGTATDNVGVASVVWSSNRGASGTCTGTTSWSTGVITLLEGSNIITIGASDSSGNNATDVITVTYEVAETTLNVKIKNPTTKDKVSRNSKKVTIIGTATDDSLVASVSWYNATTGDSGACSLEGETFTASDIDLVAGDNVIITAATDDAGNMATDTLTITQMDCSPGPEWRGLSMVSLPIVPDNTDPLVEVGFSRNYWCNFHATRNAYQLYPDAMTWLEPADATPGRGFWGYFDNPVDGPYGNIPPQEQPATIHLIKGWNLIGNPFVSPVTWSISAIMVKGPDGVVKPLGSAQGVVQSHAWGWRQDESDPSKGEYYLVYDATVIAGVDGQMLPWHAYWIKANKDCDLIIPAP